MSSKSRESMLKVLIQINETKQFFPIFVFIQVLFQAPLLGLSVWEIIFQRIYLKSLVGPARDVHKIKSFSTLYIHILNKYYSHQWTKTYKET